jgi:hypothetical protein
VAGDNVGHGDGEAGAGSNVGPVVLTFLGVAAFAVGTLVMERACGNYTECRGIERDRKFQAEASRVVAWAGVAAALGGATWLIASHHADSGSTERSRGPARGSQGPFGRSSGSTFEELRLELSPSYVGFGLRW